MADESKAMSIQEAYCAFPYQAICEDGMVVAEEFEALLAQIAKDKALTGSSAPELLGRVDDHFSRLGPDFLNVAGSIVPPELRLDAFRAAALMAASDDDMGPKEEAFLAQAQRALGLAPTDTQKILHEIRPQ